MSHITTKVPASETLETEEGLKILARIIARHLKTAGNNQGHEDILVPPEIPEKKVHSND